MLERYHIPEEPTLEEGMTLALEERKPFAPSRSKKAALCKHEAVSLIVIAYTVPITEVHIRNTLGSAGVVR